MTLRILTKHARYSVENLGHYLRVVADSDESGFGDDVVLIGDCRIPQNWETARLIAQDLNELEAQ